MGADACDAERDALLLPAPAKLLSAFIQSQRAGHGTGGVIGLLARRAKQDVKGVADDLRHRSIVGEHDVGHADEIIVQKRTENVRFERLHQCREAGNVREQRRDLAALAAQIGAPVSLASRSAKLGEK